jgi:histidinol-phosphatase (PHP family)
MPDMLVNYHTHTWRCMHARGTEEEYVRRAIGAGFSVLGFADHTPWPYTSGFVSDMRMRWDQFPGYLETVLALREKYAGQIAIPVGLECEAFPAWFGWLRDLKAQCLDYVLLGNHYDGTDEGDHSVLSDRGGFYFGRCSRAEHVIRYAERTIAGMETGIYDYVAHPDLFCHVYASFDAECAAASRDICQAAVALDIPLEYNLLGIPKGYNAFFTRGVSGWEGHLDRCLEIARRISGKEHPNLCVYGGGADVEQWCREEGVRYLAEFMAHHRKKELNEQYRAKE